jgi:hypothetical protein
MSRPHNLFNAFALYLRCVSVWLVKVHLGLDPFSNPGEHWILQASLTHSISDELFVLSFAPVLDASALASGGLRAIGFVGGKIGSIGTASLIGFSRSKFPLSAHPARARARSKANSHFIFAAHHEGRAQILPHHALDAGGKRNGLKRKVADLLISEWSNRMSALGHKQTFAVHQRMSALPPKADMCGAASDVP